MNIIGDDSNEARLVAGVAAAWAKVEETWAAYRDSMNEYAIAEESLLSFRENRTR